MGVDKDTGLQKHVHHRLRKDYFKKHKDGAEFKT